MACHQMRPISCSIGQRRKGIIWGRGAEEYYALMLRTQFGLRLSFASLRISIKEIRIEDTDRQYNESRRECYDYHEL